MLNLREYQTDAVTAVWNNLKVNQSSLLVMATGLGKTRTIVKLCMDAIKAKPDIKIVFLVNKVNLVKQTYKVLSSFIDPNMLGVYCGSISLREGEKPLIIASIQSICRADLEKVNLLIIDETHRFNLDPKSQYMKFLADCQTKNPKLKVVGMTATPFRATGLIYGEKDSLFKDITYKKDLHWAIENGFLVRPRLKRSEQAFETKSLSIVAGDYDQGQLEALTADKTKVQAQIDDAMPRIEGRNKIVWACTCIKHAELVSSLIPEPSAVLHSKLSKAEREKALHDFESGDVRHLVFISIVSEGYDYPAIDSVILMRPTRSPVLYVQTIGRGLRTAENKEDCLVIDYGRVIENCGPLDNPRIPRKGDKKSEIILEMKFCPKCLEYVEKAALTCPDCDYVFPKAAVREYDKNLERRAHLGAALFSREVEAVWVNIKSIDIAVHSAKSGNPCLRITYYPTNFLQAPIKEYCTFSATNPWLTTKSLTKLARIGVKATGLVDALKQKPKVPTAIKVKFGQEWPEVQEVSYAIREKTSVQRSEA